MLELKVKEQIKDFEKELETAQSQTSAQLVKRLLVIQKVVVAVVENGDLKKIVDDMKMQMKTCNFTFTNKKMTKLLIVAGSKNTNIKAGRLD